MSRPMPTTQGPFRADQIRTGDPYELSHGHAIHCLPQGARGSQANLIGGAVLETDPAVEEAGVDTGFSPSPDTLRAPDIAVGNVPNEPGWVRGAPPLAVEYADTGQSEKDLSDKIPELLSAGTKIVWVVRMTGPRRVEIHEPGRPMRLAHPGDQLDAPGILENPVPVEALYDRRAAHKTIFRNLLQREGYADLDAVRAEGGSKALRSAIVDVLAARGIAVNEDLRTALSDCSDAETLRRLLRVAATVGSATEILASAVRRAIEESKK